MSDRVRGTVINLNAFGATVRLENGELVTAAQADVEAHRSAYERGYQSKKPLEFALHATARHPVAVLVPQLNDPQFEEQIAGYLKSTEEWEIPDAPPAHERHFLRKKRRAAFFESRHATDR